MKIKHVEYDERGNATGVTVALKNSYYDEEDSEDEMYEYYIIKNGMVHQVLTFIKTIRTEQVIH